MRAIEHAPSGGSGRPLMRRWPSLWSVALACLSLAAFPGLAAKKAEPVPFSGDLTAPAIRHGAECPLPKQRPCLIRKPVGRGYRVLTTGVNLEDMGEYWLADLTKLKDPKSNRAWLQVFGSNGELHEIEILFPKEPAAKAVKAEPQAPAAAKPPKEEPAKAAE